MSGKFLTIFTILFALLATIASSTPLEKRAPGDMHVPSPGPGPWKKGSVQVVSWWCNPCNPKDSVTVRIIQYSGPGTPIRIVYTETVENAYVGSLKFPIKNNWDVKKLYFASVTVNRVPPYITGRSVDFKIF
uniref:ATP-binding cassette sub-family A member 7 n=1 Tax=Anthurium amnicola TaxID=1678845 RepID=A0A1D1YIA4_9ARAE